MSKHPAPLSSEKKLCPAICGVLSPTNTQRLGLGDNWISTELNTYNWIERSGGGEGTGPQKLYTGTGLIVWIVGVGLNMPRATNIFSVQYSNKVIKYPINCCNDKIATWNNATCPFSASHPNYSDCCCGPAPGCHNRKQSGCCLSEIIILSSPTFLPGIIRRCVCCCAVIEDRNQRGK